MWVKDPSCTSVVRNTWEWQTNNSRRTPIGKRIDTTTNSLRYWNKKTFGLYQNRISDIEQKIRYLQSLNPSNEIIFQENSCHEELREWLNRQEMLWHLKSRELWLTIGDQNSKFFHVVAISNKRRIFIAILKNNSGEWHESWKTIGKFLIDEFSNLFHMEHTVFGQFLGDYFQPSITEEQNSILHAIPNEKEILNTVNNLHPTKASRPNGMPALFFQHFWGTVGKDVTTAIQNIFRHGCFPQGFNDTFIVLIPKTCHFSTFNHIRPIVLCNTIYKMFLKILVHRICPLLKFLISPHQAAFMPGH